MNDDAIFAASAARRHAVADFLEPLDEKQLDTESLCAGWSVRVVAGHLLAVVMLSGSAFLLALVRSGFRPHVANGVLARRVAARTGAELAAGLRKHADRRFKPPVVGAFGPLTDLLVHEADMRLPLNLPYDPPPADVEVALGFLTGRAPGFVPKGRLTGIRLAPNDLNRTWGEGAEVTGRAADIMLAVCGRPAALPSLSGPGAAMLAERVRSTG